MWLLDDTHFLCGISLQRDGGDLEVTRPIPSGLTQIDIVNGSEAITMSISIISAEQLSLFNAEELKWEGEGKVCTKCDRHLPFSAYTAASGGNYLRSSCRQCDREQQKIANDLRDIHGMPGEDYECPICHRGAEEVKQHNGSWVLDHCHETKNFRGWLCHKCNRALGSFNDNIKTIQRAIIYLESSNESNTD